MLLTPDDLPENWRRKITVNPDGCWIWTGAKTTNKQYARVRIASEPIYLHKHLFQLANPDFADVSKLPRLFRRCQTPLCVNPEHWDVDYGEPADPWTPHHLGRKRKVQPEPEPDPPFALDEPDFDEADLVPICVDLIESHWALHGRPRSLDELTALPQFSGIPAPTVAEAANQLGLDL